MTSRLIVVFAAIGVGIGLAHASCKEPCTVDTCLGCCDSNGDCQVGNKPAACGKKAVQCSNCGSAPCEKQVCLVIDSGIPETDGGCFVGVCGANVCNVSTGSCVSPAACDAQQLQPGGCAGGQICNQGTCRDVARPTCPNYLATSAPLRWTPAQNFGPVIYSARAVSFSVDAVRCPSGATRRAIVELSAYDFNARFADGGYPKLFVYRENQTLGEVRDNVTVAPSPNGGNATLQVASCGPESVTMLTLGYAFENGNGSCVTLVP